MSGSLNDKMGVWRGSRLCPWRRALHLYVLYTTYLVTFTSPVKMSTKSTTYPATQEPISEYTCTTCRETDIEQQTCSSMNSCNGTLNCSRVGNAIKCLFQCRNEHLETTVLLSIKRNENCNADPPDNIVVCGQINGQTLQFKKPDSFSEMHFKVTCSPVFTTCPCCPSVNRCCDGLWNCEIKPLENPTSSPTTSTKATTTSSRGTTSPYTTTTTTPTTTNTTTTATTKTSGIVTEGRSTASQTDIDYVPTIAVLASLLVLSIIVIGIIVVIVLRRNRRKKEAENSDFIFSNTAYVDVTQHHKPHPGLNNPKSSMELPAKSEDDEEHTYCYPSYDDSKQTVDTESQQPNIQDLPIKTMTYSTNSYSQKHGNNCKMNQAIVTDQSVEKDSGHPNDTLGNPSNYFVLEKSKSIDGTNGPETGDSANYFVLETTSEHEPRVNRNHEGEITETGETSLGTIGENYFLVDKPDVGTISDNRDISNLSFNQTTVENHDLTSNENYFVLDKNTDDSKPTETRCNDGLQTSDNTPTGAQPRTKDTPTTTADPYDHVRIGNAHTNGFDDGVYDELRKQNVRYEAEGVENDYDHC